MTGLVHFVLLMASVVSLVLVGPWQTHRKALRAFVQSSNAESKPPEVAADRGSAEAFGLIEISRPGRLNTYVVSGNGFH